MLAPRLPKNNPEAAFLNEAAGPALGSKGYWGRCDRQAGPAGRRAAPGCTLTAHGRYAVSRKLELMIVLAIVSGITFASPVYAQSVKCGFQPFPPAGCKPEKARCICEAQGGGCHWEFVCG
jgi:hypothetical protein